MAKGDELKKKRADKYEKSMLAINGTFDEVIKTSFLGKSKAKDGDELKALKAKKEADKK